MAVPITFPSATPHFSLPLLFAGQAQKEFFVNQSLSLIDTLLQNAVVASIANPPLDAEEGASYRVTSLATDSWTGHEDEIAIKLGGGWHFLMPTRGMTIFDRQAGTFVHYQLDWQTAAEPTLQRGGDNIDAEARQMLTELIEALRSIGIFANPRSV